MKKVKKIDERIALAGKIACNWVPVLSKGDHIPFPTHITPWNLPKSPNL